MKTFALSLTTLSAAALFAGCASGPTVTPQLTQARSSVSQASADPAVSKYAALELKKASDSLRRADELSAQRESPADIDSAAYVAMQQARTAQTLAKAASDEDAIKAAEAEREPTPTAPLPPAPERRPTARRPRPPWPAPMRTAPVRRPLLRRPMRPLRRRKPPRCSRS